jgi:predicted MFS family arabinose efflux permease
MQGSSTVAQVSGPGLAGVLVQALGAPLALFVDACSYLASIMGLTAARRPEPAVEPGARGRLRDGLALLLRNPYLRAVTTHATIYNAAAQIFVVNLVVWVVRERSVSPALYGLALSAGGVGAFVGTMVALQLAARLGFGRAFAASLTLSCGVPMLTALLPWHGSPMASGLAVLQAVAGAGLGSANVLSTTLRQTVIPLDQLARTNGAYRNLNFGSIPLGAAAAGILGEAFGSRCGVAVGTIGLAISALPMMAPAIRSLREPQDASPTP